MNLTVQHVYPERVKNLDEVIQLALMTRVDQKRWKQDITYVIVNHPHSPASVSCVAFGNGLMVKMGERDYARIEEPLTAEDSNCIKLVQEFAEHLQEIRKEYSRSVRSPELDALLTGGIADELLERANQLLGKTPTDPSIEQRVCEELRNRAVCAGYQIGGAPFVEVHVNEQLSWICGRTNATWSYDLTLAGNVLHSVDSKIVSDSQDVGAIATDIQNAMELIADPSAKNGVKIITSLAHDVSRTGESLEATLKRLGHWDNYRKFRAAVGL